MGIMRFFGRKKKEEKPDEEAETAAAGADAAAEGAGPAESEAVAPGVAEEAAETGAVEVTAAEVEIEPAPAATEEAAAPAEETLEYDLSEVEEAEARRAPLGDTIPYHSTLQDRLIYLFGDAEVARGIEAPDSFCIEFMAMGERFRLEKPSMGDVQVKTGAARDSDVFIRIANEVVSELLSASDFSEFSDIFMRYYRSPEPDRYVKVELRKDITDMNRRGYARVPILKLLAGSLR